MIKDNEYSTVLVEVKAQSIIFEETKRFRGDYVLLPRHMAVQFKDAVRILTRSEQLLKEAEFSKKGDYDANT